MDTFIFIVFMIIFGALFSLLYYKNAKNKTYEIVCNWAKQNDYKITLYYDSLKLGFFITHMKWNTELFVVVRLVDPSGEIRHAVLIVSGKKAAKGQPENVKVHWHDAAYVEELEKSLKLENKAPDQDK